MTPAMFWSRCKLQNGLTVLLFPRPTANTTQLSIAVEYGSNQENAEIAGVAHFIEHMIAGGSERRIQLSRSVENSGGILNFFTQHESMQSTMDILPEQLTEASNILSDLLFSVDFEEEKFGLERKIILNELEEAEDDPAERIDELLLSSLFKNHPIKRPVGGFPKTIKQLTLNQLSDAHKTNYVPQNMILILTGNFNEKTAELVLEKFGGVSCSENFSQKTNWAENAKPKSLVVKKKAGITQTYLSIGARTVFSSHPDAATLDLISTVLSGGTSSRLFVELREKNALTYSVNATHNKGVDFGYFNVDCAVENKNLAKAEELILKELSTLRTTKVPLEELERSKNLIVAEILREMDNPQEACEILAYLEMQYKSERALTDYIAKIKAVSSDNILEAAKTYLKADCLATVRLEPTK
jgi:predicted Zn-dependent peptidase